MIAQAQFTISDETFDYAASMKPDEVGYHIHVAEGMKESTGIDLQALLAGYAGGKAAQTREPASV